MDIIKLLHSNYPLIIAISGIFGLIIGSFLNVIIYRLPIILKKDQRKDCLKYLDQQIPTEDKKFNICTPRSHCPKCKTTIPWWQNIPIVSFLILKGRCQYCKTHISWRYPITEIITCIATISVTVHFGPSVQALAMLVLTWCLIVATFIDFEQQLLPDNITLPLIWLGLLLNTNYIFTTPQNAIIGVISAYLFLWIIAKIFKLIRKIDGMGYGDFKLFAIFGAWLGWQALPLIILVASLAGTIGGLLILVSKKLSFTKPLPFGPYLATAGWLAFFIIVR